MTSKEQFRSSGAQTRYCKQRAVSASVLRNHCAGVKIIWQRHRGSRIWEVGFGGYRAEMPCTYPTNGIASTASIQKRDRHHGKSDCSAFIQKIEPSMQ